MFCNNCGKEVNNTDIFCGNCGTKQLGTNKGKRKFTFKNNKIIKLLLKALIIAICILLFFMAITGIIFFFNKNKGVIENNANDITNTENNYQYWEYTTYYSLGEELSIYNAENVKLDENGKLTYFKDLIFKNTNSLKYEYDNTSRIIRIEHIVEDEEDDKKVEFEYNIEYIDNTNKINKIIRSLKTTNRDNIPAIYGYTTPDYVEVIYTYDEKGNITKINEVNYITNVNTKIKTLIEENIYTFSYDFWITITKKTRTLQFKWVNDDLIENGYKTETIYSISGEEKNIRVGKNAYEELLVHILGRLYIVRSEAEKVNDTEFTTYENYIMYPRNIIKYKNNVKDIEYAYVYNDNNYLHSTGSLTDNAPFYYYKYVNNKMGKFKGNNVEHDLIEEFTLENGKIITKEDISSTRFTTRKDQDIELLEKEYEDDDEIPVQYGDSNLKTYDNNSYYMYVYLEDNKKDFVKDLQLIGGVWEVGVENDKYVLYVKFDVYDRVYNKIKNMDGVKEVEKTTKIFKMEDLDKIETPSNTASIMQVFVKDSKFLRREFYTFCSNYR